MKYCSLLFIIELTLELVISFIIKAVNYPGLFAYSLIFKNWLLIAIYKLPVFFLFAVFLPTAVDGWFVAGVGLLTYNGSRALGRAKLIPAGAGTVDVDR